MPEERQGPFRVLVVDDEPSNRLLAERALVSAGYSVHTASNAPEALAAIQQQGVYDLYVLDIRMPGMPGTELAEKIRDSQPDAKVLFYTAFSDRLFDGRRTLQDNEAFLQKPVGLRDLTEAASLILFGHLRGPQPRG